MRVAEFHTAPSSRAAAPWRHPRGRSNVPITKMNDQFARANDQIARSNSSRARLDRSFVIFGPSAARPDAQTAPRNPPRGRMNAPSGPKNSSRGRVNDQIVLFGCSLLRGGRSAPAEGVLWPVFPRRVRNLGDGPPGGGGGRLSGATGQSSGQCSAAGVPGAGTGRGRRACRRTTYPPSPSSWNRRPACFDIAPLGCDWPVFWPVLRGDRKCEPSPHEPALARRCTTRYTGEWV